MIVSLNVYHLTASGRYACVFNASCSSSCSQAVCKVIGIPLGSTISASCPATAPIYNTIRRALIGSASPYRTGLLAFDFTLDTFHFLAFRPQSQSCRPNNAKSDFRLRHGADTQNERLATPQLGFLMIGAIRFPLLSGPHLV